MRFLTPVQLRTVAFGRASVIAGDLDPEYVIVYASRMTERQKDKFVVAYSMFYHSGVAAKCAEAKDFWRTVTTLLPTAPRGGHRRHFRANNAAKTVAFLMEYDPSALIAKWRADCRFKSVYDSVLSCVGYGPMFGFKIADMLDRCYDQNIDFAGAARHMYASPRKGAGLWLDKTGGVSTADLETAMSELLVQLVDLRAPPRYNRPVGIPEAETILCGLSSHGCMNVKYAVGTDCRTIKDDLAGWGDLAQELAACPLLDGVPDGVYEQELLRVNRLVF